jgi:dipeptidyl aminopeptidase/acylaminoacyl peptidase
MLNPAVQATLPPPTLTTATPLPSNTPVPSATLLPTPTWTLEPYAGMSIGEMAARSYGGGMLVVEEVLADNTYFTRYLVSYPSDGLKIYGFMNIPKRSSPPYPVVIALHGYIDPGIYDTLDYTTRYADVLARAGYLVLHPNLRGYPPSDGGDNLFRIGMAVDVLNLIAIIKSQAGLEGALSTADPQAIGLWGHSMGGGISTRVVAVSADVKAAVLYGAMSGDERKNFERIFTYFSNGTRGIDELTAPQEVFDRVSPINYLDRIQAAISIHHGSKDPDVPPEWSSDLCQRLRTLKKDVECFFYADQAHTFRGEDDQLFTMRTVEFFDRVLKKH